VAGYGCNPTLICLVSQLYSGSRSSWVPTWIMLYIMIEAPHPLHTHSRSSSYIYIVFQHLLLWLQVIRMQHQPDIYLVSQSKVGVGDSPGFAMGLHCYISLGHLTHFILIAGLLQIYIKCFSTCYCGYRS
jgi:hypothetical protein